MMNTQRAYDTNDSVSKMGRAASISLDRNFEESRFRFNRGETLHYSPLMEAY